MNMLEQHFDLNMIFLIWKFNMSGSDTSHFANNLRNNAHKIGKNPMLYFFDLCWALLGRKWEVKKEDVLLADLSLLKV